MSGSDTRKYTCPFFSLHYLAMKKVPRRGGVVTGGKLFEIYDDDAFIRADPETVAEVAIETCIVASRAGAVGSHRPSPVPIEETLSRKNGDEYTKWKPGDWDFPV